MILLTPQVFNNLLSKSKSRDQSKSDDVVKAKRQRKKVFKPIVSQNPSQEWIKTKQHLSMLPSIKKQDHLLHKIEKVNHPTRAKVLGVRKRVEKNEKNNMMSTDNHQPLQPVFNMNNEEAMQIDDENFNHLSKKRKLEDTLDDDDDDMFFQPNKKERFTQEEMDLSTVENLKHLRNDEDDNTLFFPDDKKLKIDENLHISKKLKLKKPKRTMTHLKRKRISSSGVMISSSDERGKKRKQKEYVEGHDAKKIKLMSRGTKRKQIIQPVGHSDKKSKLSPLQGLKRKQKIYPSGQEYKKIKLSSMIGRKRKLLNDPFGHEHKKFKWESLF